MTPKARAQELCNEWFPDSPADVREIFIQQFTAEFQHVMQQGYSAGYNACTRENLAVNKNAVREMPPCLEPAVS